MAKTTSIVTLAQAERFFNKQLRYIKRATRSLEKAEKYIVRVMNREESPYFLDWYFSEKNVDVSIRLKIEKKLPEIVTDIEQKLISYNCVIEPVKAGKKFIVRYSEPVKEQVEVA